MEESMIWSPFVEEVSKLYLFNKGGSLRPVSRLDDPSRLIVSFQHALRRIGFHSNKNNIQKQQQWKSQKRFGIFIAVVVVCCFFFFEIKTKRRACWNDALRRLRSSNRDTGRSTDSAESRQEPASYHSQLQQLPRRRPGSWRPLPTTSGATKNDGGSIALTMGKAWP